MAYVYLYLKIAKHFCSVIETFYTPTSFMSIVYMIGPSTLDIVICFDFSHGSGSEIVSSHLNFNFIDN